MHDPRARRQARQLFEHDDAGRGKERAVGQRGARERPPEHVGVRPRRREHEATERADGKAQQAAAQEAGPPDREQHHGDEQYDAPEKRVAVRQTDEREVDGER